MFLSCSDIEGSRLKVVLSKSPKDRGWVDDDVVTLKEPGSGLCEDVARQLIYRATELGIEGSEVALVEEVE